MTKRKLLELLAPFADDQYVYVRLSSKEYSGGAQIIIQDVGVTPPWHPGPDLVALIAHEGNKIIISPEREREICKTREAVLTPCEPQPWPNSVLWVTGEAGETASNGKSPAEGSTDDPRVA